MRYCIRSILGDLLPQYESDALIQQSTLSLQVNDLSMAFCFKDTRVIKNTDLQQTAQSPADRASLPVSDLHSPGKTGGKITKSNPLSQLIITCPFQCCLDSRLSAVLRSYVVFWETCSFGYIPIKELGKFVRNVP